MARALSFVGSGAALAIAALFALAGALEGVADAQPATDLTTARQAFKDGEDAEARGDLAVAIARFRDASAFKATPQLLLRIGAVEEKMGRLVDALASYEEGREKAASMPQIASLAGEQIQALRPRVPVVVIVVAGAPPDVAITVDGARVAATLGRAEVRVDPGLHRVHVQAPGRVASDLTFTAKERGRDVLDVTLAVEAGGEPTPKPAPDAAAPSRLPGALLTSAGVVLAIGGAALVGGSYAEDNTIDGLCGGSNRTRCPASQKSTILSDVTTATALRFTGIPMAVVGVGLAAGGIYLLARRTPPPATGFLVLPMVGPSARGLTVIGRY